MLKPVRVRAEKDVKKCIDTAKAVATKIKEMEEIKGRQPRRHESRYGKHAP